MVGSKRLRASNACEYCRQRKTRCDEGNPSCSLCLKRGITCHYKQATPSKLEKSINDIHLKIENIEKRFQAMEQQGSFNGRRVGELLLLNDSWSAKRPKVEVESSWSNFFPSNSISAEIDNLADLVTNEEQNSEILGQNMYLIPNLSTLMAKLRTSAKLSLNSCYLSLNCEEFLIEEDKYSYKGRLDDSTLQYNNVFSTSLVENFIQSYLNYIYPVYPLVCEDQLGNIQNEMSTMGLHSSCRSCILLMVLALGSVSSSGDLKNLVAVPYWTSDEYKQEGAKNLPAPPGWSYLWLALAMKERLITCEKPGSATVCIQLLFCLYFLKIGDLTSHYIELKHSSTQLYCLLLKQRNTELSGLSVSEDEKEKLIRFFWISLRMERDFQRMVNIETSPLSQLQNCLDLPSACSTKFPRDSVTFYTFCFMTNVLLSNIKDKTIAVLVNVGKFTTDNIFLAISKFESDLKKWRLSLTVDIQWEECMFLEERGPEMTSLKLTYYICLVFVYHLLIHHINLTDLDISENFIAKSILRKSVDSAVRAIELFSSMSIDELTPGVCHDLLISMKILDEAISILDDFEEEADISRVLSKAPLIQLNLEKFGRHSPLIEKDLKTCDDILQLLGNKART
ncbi:uncharacterized protein PRCAT00004326001 [Priceomyces carsonii]|uniref:uncharacterized protein n=1 Tax=Priceomyces carsonii TaxID=28549 RepID=UPI002ED8C3BA|nr:unnamed protein product [Priceomyces carsonii]